MTKEAKHIEDKNYKVNILDELKFRNILHSIAALWSYQRLRGQQGELKKIEICQLFEGKKLDEKDLTILDKYKEIKDFEFLSHSYFGEKGDTIHFQHQSFAEILLAEYYLKVFIHYALAKNTKVENARIKLLVGEPTDQVIEFFKELLDLLKACSTDEVNDVLIKKRKMLFPLLASLTVEEYSFDMYNQELYYQWFKVFEKEFQDNQTSIPNKSIYNWPISNIAINKIISFSNEILNNETEYFAHRTKAVTTLFDDEISICVGEHQNSYPDIDRWLGLLVGNKLFSKTKEYQQFASTITNIDLIVYMIRNWNRTNNVGLPNWGDNLLKGLDFSLNEASLVIENIIFDEIDFTDIKFKQITFSNCIFISCIFENTNLIDVSLNLCSLYLCKFENCKFEKSNFVFTNFGYKNLFPLQLNFWLDIEMLAIKDDTSLNYNEIIYVQNQAPLESIINENLKKSKEIDLIFETIFPFFKYAITTTGLKIEEIKKWYKFENNDTKKQFHDKLRTLKKYEIEYLKNGEASH